MIPASDYLLFVSLIFTIAVLALVATLTLDINGIEIIILLKKNHTYSGYDYSDVSNKLHIGKKIPNAKMPTKVASMITSNGSIEALILLISNAISRS